MSVSVQAAAAVAAPALPRIARDHIVSLAKLVVDYALQPIVEINTGYVYGYEALMRGFDRLGLESPIALLDHAAEADVLVALEQMLHARAIAKFASLPDAAGKKLFINVDGRTLSSGHLILGAVAKVLESKQIPASTLCFELSERYDNDAEPTFGAVVGTLRTMGGRLAIDDFGLGVSELKLLCDYGIDYIKIDGHFIRGMAQSQRKRLLVTTISNLAHVLGIRVIAEGVETEAEYLACREAGCDLVQGYFVARPTCEMSEILGTYPHVVTARAKHRRDRKTDELLIRNQMAALPTVAIDAELPTVFDLFRRAPQESFFPVVDDAGEPRGILHERDLKQYIYMPFGRDLLNNRAYQRRVSSFVTACPIVDIATDAEHILEVFANARSSDGVIVTENLKYIGVLSTAALLSVINDKKIQQAQDQNPLTELPGNLSITDFVAVNALDGDALRHFCYFDFDDFKPFNDRYGFPHGDRAISLFATLMRRSLGGPGTLLGHVGGDDFFAGFRNRAPEELRPILTQLLDEFRREARKLYGAEDQRLGFTTGRDRDGRSRRFDLLRCSVAVLELPPGTVTSDLDKIHAAMAQAKSQAKHEPTGVAWRAFTA
ncbi:MAG: GGDEF domain-containing protein [Rhodoplanes sp.]|uniref:GGDEF domain-containing protein n=1 Tax=Rhodoplanes sp. TaxID=1968906 RepID=UPI0017AD6CC2|nr:GGDEF domain-containing protein [Rhodoplanes sp.]NVO14502.1 GGDEF domain-containing protein [Rhodoplanes sp.]